MHFTVLVVGENFEKQLAPYQENNMGDCPKEYMKFYSAEEEYMEEYNNNTATKIKMPDGRILDRCDKEFHVKKADNHTEVVVPEELERVEIPLKEIYPTFDEFCQNYLGYRDKDPETGKYGHWENPNRKWDWYQVGGRWCGFFKLKDGAKGEVGSPGLMTPPAEEGNADSVMKKDIDFEGMRKEAGDNARKAYQKIVEKFGGSIPKLDFKWKDFVDSEEAKEMDWEDRRKKYHSQPAVAAMDNLRKKLYNEAKSREEKDEIIHFWLQYDNIEDLQCTEEEYVERAKNQVCATYALVKDGVWYEKGEIGWFGTIGTVAEVAWYKEFARLIDSLPEETLLTVVDCHI